MANPNDRWNAVPVWGFYFNGDDVTPQGGKVVLTLTQRVSRVDGRRIYPEGARIERTIGDTDADPVTRDAVRAAWRAADEAKAAAAGEVFDGAVWDARWNDLLKGSVFASFPASDDPDIVQTGYQVKVEERLNSGAGKIYYVQPLLAHLDGVPPGINLGLIEVPPGSPTAPAPVYAKGLPGGVAPLDADGDVVDAEGTKVKGVSAGVLAAKADLVEGAVPDVQLPDRLADTALRAASVAAVKDSGAFVPARALSVRAAELGAIGDGRSLSDGAITSGGKTLTSAAGVFTAADVGKLVAVAGAGAPVTTTLSAALSTSAPIASLPVAALPAATAYGTVTLDDGVGNTQTFTVGAAAAGATSVPVKYTRPTFAFPAGTTVTLGTPLITTVTAVSGPTSVTLAAAAARTVSAAQWCIGTDNTAALQAAIDQGHRIFLDAGSYMVGTLTIPSETTIEGPNGSGLFRTTGRSARLLLKPGTNGPLLTGAASGSQYVVLRDIKLDGQAPLQTAQAPLVRLPDLAAAQEAHWTLDTLLLVNASGVGVYLGVNNRGTKITNCYVYAAGSHGIQCEGTDNQIIGNYIGACLGYGVYCRAAGWSNMVIGNNIWTNRIGVRAESVYGIQVIANYVDTNLQQGVSADAVGGFTVIGNQFSPQSQAMDGIAAIIELSNMVQNAMIGGNSFYLPGGNAWANRPNYCIYSTSDWIDGGNARQGGETRFGYSGGPGVTVNDLRGRLTHRGDRVGFYGVTPVARAASPGTATGTDAAVINAVVTALRNLGLVS